MVKQKPQWWYLDGIKITETKKSLQYQEHAHEQFHGEVAYLCNKGKRNMYG